jgi:hypothetical protein
MRAEAMTTNRAFPAAAPLLLLAAAAAAQPPAYRARPAEPGEVILDTDGAGHDMEWNTVDAGGGRLGGGAGALVIEGTAGQADAGSMSAGALVLSGGFWPALGAGAAPCYANCDQSTTPPVLNVLDFNCFLTRFAAGDAAANCDGSTAAPVLNVMDFNCFLNRFAAGCP